MRSMAAAQAVGAIRSYLSTPAEHGIGKLDALTRAASGGAETEPDLPPRAEAA